MNQRNCIQAGAMAAGLLMAAHAWGDLPGPVDRPNIVLILADDMGIGDLRCYNRDSKVPAPHMDRLAAEGMRFTDAYCPNSVCTPTRYALMAGRYAWRTRLRRGVQANWEPPLIEDGRLTLPELLRQAGYHTAGFGKWHLGAHFPTTDGKPPAGRGKFTSPDTGANIDFTKPIRGGPTDRGFDVWFGFICGTEKVIYEQDRVAAILQGDDPRGFKPPQSPLLAPTPDIQLVDYQPELTRRAVEYIGRRAEAAKAGSPFFLAYLPYVPHIPIAPTAEFQGTTQAGEYGDYVHQFDHHVGLLTAALDEHGLRENTMVVVASDNGSQFETTGEAHWPNAPFSGTKWTVQEGGVRAPLLVRWPGKVAPGSVSDQLIGLMDVFATCAAVLGKELPAGAGEDSVNMLPVLVGEAQEPLRESIVVQASDGTMAFRHGRWKLVPGFEGKRTTQLYDLAADPGEKNNLAAEQPERVATMKAALSRIIAEERRIPPNTGETQP